MLRRPRRSTPFPCTTLFRPTALVTGGGGLLGPQHAAALAAIGARVFIADVAEERATTAAQHVSAETGNDQVTGCLLDVTNPSRSEEHTSELQSQSNLVCRLL